ncbi:MAG: hypothetical protein U0104_13650 [Gemmatimonadales bacterium]|nr:hypothetical protein [Gemmatimonadales bacterium]
MTTAAALPLLAAAMLLSAPLAPGAADPAGDGREPAPDWPAAWEWVWLLPAALALLAGGG